MGRSLKIQMASKFVDSGFVIKVFHILIDFTRNHVNTNVDIVKESKFLFT